VCRFVVAALSGAAQRSASGDLMRLDNLGPAPPGVEIVVLPGTQQIEITIEEPLQLKAVHECHVPSRLMLNVGVA
jgi:hypothetical protein